MRLLVGSVATTAIFCSPAIAQAETYEVGPGQTFEAITDVPLEALGPGDIVRVAWRAEPYRERFGIDTAGTADAPIVIQGVPDEDGRLPVLDAEDAIEGHAAHVRGVIHIVGDAAHVVVENFEIRNANAASGLEDNSAGVFAPEGRHLTFRNLDLHHNGNGLFTWHLSSDVLVEGCHIHDNGNVDSLYEHNIYSESDGITFQYNLIAPLLPGALGNNLKDRSHHAVIRYNWIEGGNRCLDLVEAEDGTWSYDDAADYVYGNVLVKHDDTSQSQVIHYGGDNDSAPDRQRLYLFHNTVHSDRPGNTTLLFINAAAWAGAYNNVFHGTGDALELVDPDDSDAARVEFGANWITEGWFVGSTDANVTGQDAFLEGTDPGLAAIPSDFAPLEDAVVVDAGITLPDALADHPVDSMYGGLGMAVQRDDPGLPDLGAFAWAPENDANDTGSTSSGTGAESGSEEASGSPGDPTGTSGSANDDSTAETGIGSPGTSTSATSTTTAGTTSTHSTSTDSGEGSSSDPLPAEPNEGGCSCSTRPADRAPLALWMTLPLAALLHARRRSASRRTEHET